MMRKPLKILDAKIFNCIIRHKNHIPPTSARQRRAKNGERIAFKKNMEKSERKQAKMYILQFMRYKFSKFAFFLSVL